MTREVENPGRITLLQGVLRLSSKSVGTVWEAECPSYAENAGSH